MQQGCPHPPVPFPGPQKIQPHVLNRRGGGHQLRGEIYIRRLLTLPTKGTFYLVSKSSNPAAAQFWHLDRQ